MRYELFLIWFSIRIITDAEIGKEEKDHQKNLVKWVKHG
jgi:hypothetical protein